MIQYSLLQKIRFGFGAALLLLIIISVISIGSVYQHNQKERWVNHTYDVQLSLEQLISILKDAESGARGYVLGKELRYLTPYTEAIAAVDPAFDQLESLIIDNPQQIENFNLLKKITRRRLSILSLAILHSRNNNETETLRIIRKGEGHELMMRIRHLASRMRAEEKLLLESRKNITRISANLLYIIIGVGNGLAVVLMIVALYYISKDLAIRKEAEVMLEQKQEKLEQINKELEAFTYTISHDLRSPLRAIDGFGKMLVEDYTTSLDAEGRRMLNVIRNNASRMGKLIDDLLEFSRLNRKGIVKSAIEMTTLVEEIIQEVQLTNYDGKAEVIVKELANAPCDAALLHQVWINLISNAFKYSSGKAKPRIEIGCIVRDTEVEYYVEDNGAGFDMKYKDKLFGIFQRLHSEKEFQGTGVGLAIVNRIITRHGGITKAHGMVNEGSRFSFTLPLQ